MAKGQETVVPAVLGCTRPAPAGLKDGITMVDRKVLEENNCILSQQGSPELQKHLFIHK